MAEKSYYEVLGVDRSADQKAIKEAFRKLALRYHPDRSKEPGAAERFKEIAAAYAVLSDPHKRAEYDARGRSAEAYAPEDLFGGADFGDLGFGGLGGGFGGDWFERLFGGLGGARRGVRRGPDLEMELHVPLQRIAQGGAESVRYQRPGGGGEETLAVHVPAGAEEGTVLRYPGRGMPAPGGQPGDLHVVIRSQPDPRFTRRGPNLLVAATIGVAEAALGTELDVATLDGRAHVKVPPGTQPGTVLRLRGKGLPKMGERGRGDMLVTVHVHVPERLDREQRRAFEALRQRGV